MGLKVGDKVTLEGSIYPGDWTFNVSGIYTATRKSFDDSQFLFHWNYLNDSLPERRRDELGWVVSRVDAPGKGASIAQAIYSVFDQRDTQTTTMSERAMNLSFLGMFSAILTALDIVSVIILAIMMMILGNTIAMGVRERTREFAVLRAIGFTPVHVRTVIIGEAALFGVPPALVGPLPPPIRLVVVVSAGTSAAPVAAAPATTARVHGAAVRRVDDVGVTGLHRLLDAREELADADALVVVAGMEGALPSVVGGLSGVPLVAVPTSVGYGASFGGIAALLAMLNSCAPGVVVVNIDNGYGAGVHAARVARAVGRARAGSPRSAGRAP